jgi:hypothetical protein
VTLAAAALMVAWRTPTLLPLDDCRSAWPATRPHLTRAAVPRGRQRHGLSRLPDTAGEKPAKQQFTRDPLGDVHLDRAEVHTEEGQRSLCVAIDRACQLADAERHPEAS